ncbi:hypothetical protein AJ80_02449 [Polytolypa hystricis UAMH7299]|uniref:AB hydrolase-1 domain-containing protein n=1 Tax=Polytolypa hystricis (strain UAMH7299) TaxID=1447883 RepID=A0A2B7YQB9_POLH7|nr:hypothetical protein AJ80_02449 [Polytolypa hystricis UAMH7299]
MKTPSPSRVATPPTTSDWETQATKSDLVSIGAHGLFFSISGPLRQHPHDPIVIVFAGAGDSTASYIVVERLVSHFARILLYDRSGLGKSEPSPDPSHTSAEIAARELSTALETANIRPPYTLLAHSYGAIVAREFLHLHEGDSTSAATAGVAVIAGMILAEAATERQSQFFKLPEPNITAVMGDLNFARVTGLRDDAQLTRDEWRARAMEWAGGAVAAQAEADAFIEVCEGLAAKKQFERCAMGDRPVNIIRCNSARDFERIYEKGVEVGNGTEAQRRAFRELLMSWDDVDRKLKEEQCRLSTNCHLVHVPDCGHHVHLVRPDVVADEVKWVINSVREQARSSL